MGERKFKNSSIRLGRATDHLAAFKAEWERLSQLRFGSVVHYDRHSGWFVASLTADAATRDALRKTTLPLVLGEYAYQLRAALDGLIWDAITFSQGKEPPVDANRLDFPVLNGKIREFKDCGFLRFPFPEKLKVWLESIQPDSAKKSLGHPDRGLTEALEDVHNLARFDRHRRLRLIASYPTELHAKFIIDPAEEFAIVEKQSLPCNFFADKYGLLRFKVRGTDGRTPRRIRLETNAKFEIFFEDIPEVEGAPSGTRLGQLCDAVQYVIDRFEEEFAAFTPLVPSLAQRTVP